MERTQSRGRSDAGLQEFEPVPGCSEPAASPSPFTPAALLALQHSAGNRVVARMLSSRTAAATSDEDAKATTGNRVVARALLQRVQLGTPAELNQSFETYSTANEPTEATTPAGHVASYRQWLARNGDTLSPLLDQTLTQGQGALVIFNMATVPARFTTWSLANEPQDGEATLTYVSRFRTGIMAAVQLVTGEAHRALLASVRILPSANINATWHPWVLAHEPGDADTIAAYVDRFRADVAAQRTPITAQARHALLTTVLVPSARTQAVYQQWIASGPANARGPAESLAAHVQRFRQALFLNAPPGLLTSQSLQVLAMAELGQRIASAMAAANAATAGPNPLVAYPGVPYDRGGVFGPQVSWPLRQGMLPPAFWAPIVGPHGPRWNFALRAGVSAAQAVNAAFAGPSRLECLSLTTAVLAKGLLDTIGAANFDQLFAHNTPADPGIVIGTDQEPLLSRIAQLRQSPNVNATAQLIPGDWIYFANDVRYPRKHPAGLWQGENLVYDGGNLYSGFGLQGQTLQALRQAMELHYRAPPSTADMADPNYDPTIWAAERNLQHIPVHVRGLQFNTVQRFRPQFVRQFAL